MFNSGPDRGIRIIFFGVLVAALRLAAADPSVDGTWQTIDDRTHRVRGTVRLYEQGGVIFGKIETSVNPKDAADVCDLCDGERRNKPIIGLVFLRNMKKQGSEYGGGDILDPDTGRVYRCKMTLEDGGKRLLVRGFLGISLLGRSQVWVREK
jgi:uncharacterized protein (DUF2147 family)